jgi:hypothetical protein
MIKTILGILGLLVIGTMFLIVFCACIVSSRCEELERRSENEK